eukprot:6663833-Prymnesium_polylepis.2
MPHAPHTGHRSSPAPSVVAAIGIPPRLARLPHSLHPPPSRPPIAKARTTLARAPARPSPRPPAILLPPASPH